MPNLIHADVPSSENVLLFEETSFEKNSVFCSEVIEFCFPNNNRPMKTKDVSFVSHMLPLYWAEQREEEYFAVVEICDPDDGWKELIRLKVKKFIFNFVLFRLLFIFVCLFWLLFVCCYYYYFVYVLLFVADFVLLCFVLVVLLFFVCSFICLFGSSFCFFFLFFFLID
jgi:hypothetical protein